MFLDLPPRSTKPRNLGLTAVIDNGIAFESFVDNIRSTASIVDYVKFGWGTGVITPLLDEKIKVLRDNAVDFWFGGTLFEISYNQGRLRQLIQWVKDRDCKYFEISDGSLEIAQSVKLQLIRDLSKEFIVLSEVGSKDSEKFISSAQWIDQIYACLDAGAWKVLAEGRENGTAGIYLSTGEIRVGLLQDIANSDINLGRIVFEAPRREQQVWLINNFGRDVNLGNIPVMDALNLETLRLGLRSDTLLP